MSKIVLHTRSFHPDTNFGMGGLGFKGDSRGFSTSLKVTSRIRYMLPIDLQKPQIGPGICTSDTSSNAVLPRLLEGRPGAARDKLIKDDLKDAGLPGPPEPFKLLPDMSNDYSQPRKHPRSSISNENITAYRPDGDQSVNARIQYAGKNFAFYGADTDAGHWLFGGNIKEGDLSGGDLAFWKKWGGVVPDLDVTQDISIAIERENKKWRITSFIRGDGFPNCESFLLDASNKPLFLNSHVRIGTAATQLPGGRLLPMAGTNIIVDWKEGDLFGDNVEVSHCLDYTGDGSPQDVVTKRTMGLGAWNSAHTGRSATGDWIRQIEDHMPLPRQTIRKLRTGQ